MMTAEEHRLIEQIAKRAVALYERLDAFVPQWQYIAAELSIVHEAIIALRLADMLAADDSNFAHDIGGIHRHLEIGNPPRLADCFLPRFARMN